MLAQRPFLHTNHYLIMSLSFVSKSVLTARDDGGFEERAIENSESGNDNSKEGTTSQSLFEQLRANQEQADAEREEQQKAIMRGTVELNEEDRAHLDALERQKRQAEQEQRQEQEDALAAFRAARAEQNETDAHANESDNIERAARSTKPAVVPKKTAEAPAIVIRKKKRKTEGDSASNNNKKEKVEASESVTTSNTQSTSSPPASGLGDLFSGYGSSSDEDE